MKSVTLVILAGGRGSRIKNFTNLLPKPLIKCSGISLLRYIINNFSKYSIDKIYILCGYKGKLIHREFHKKIINLVEINCIIEKRPMGTGGSLYSLKKIIKNDFILINGDTVFDIDFNKFIKSKNKKSIGSIALIKNKNYKSNKKLIGIGLNKKKDIIFKNNSKLMNGGIYYLNKRIFKYIKNINSSLENDIIPNLINKSQFNGMVFDNFFLDIGTPKNLKSANFLIPNYFKKPAVFLDRDGVINYDKGYTYKIKDFKFRPGVVKAIRYLNLKNYYVFIVTNQAGIAKGFYTINDFFKLQKYIKNFLIKKNIFINDIKFSPYHPKGKIKKYSIKSNFRKPGNLMIESLFTQWNLDRKKSLMIGDKITDMKAAKKSNIKFFYVEKNLLKQVKKI